MDFFPSIYDGKTEKKTEKQKRERLIYRLCPDSAGLM